MTLKLYLDLMSQPSRAVYILLKSSKCEFQPKLINLRQGEHFGEEYTKINRLQRVPVIEHNGFVLTESVAIIRYLARENLIDEKYYPKEIKQQARVDEFLEWQHIGIRLPCSMYFRATYLEPAITGMKPNPASVEGHYKRMESALELFDTKWLGRGTDFIIGNSPTVADLLAACELGQPTMAGYDPCEKFNNIKVWWSKVRDAFNPYYDEGHVIVNKVLKKQKSAKL